MPAFLIKKGSDVVIAIFILSFLSLAVLLYNSTAPALESRNRLIQIQAEQLSLAKYAAYDSTDILGSQVQTAFRLLATEPYMHIYLVSGGNYYANPSGNARCMSFNFSTEKVLSGSTVTCTTNLDAIRNMSDTRYVLPQNWYSSKLVKDDSGVVRGILLKLK